MKNTAIEIKWAIIFTLMGLIWVWLEKMVGLHSTHIDQHPVYTNFVAIPAILIYVLALLDKRKRDYQGRMTYGQGLKSGLIITLFVTLLSPASQILVAEWISPAFFGNAIKHAVDSGLMTVTEAENFFNLKNYLIQAVIGAPVMGVITSLLVAIFVKKT